MTHGFSVHRSPLHPVPFLPSLLVVALATLVATTAFAAVWSEVGDAGQTIGTAQVTGGAGTLTTIQGTIQSDTMSGTIDFDGRKIEVQFRRTGKAVFSAQFLELEAAAEDSTRVQTLAANGEELRTRFNTDRGKTRLVMLLAPT